jgi:hypothetical protein
LFLLLPNYTVKVAEDNGGSLVAYYTFAVDGKSHQIRYYDEINGSMIPLEQWRNNTGGGSINSKLILLISLAKMES